MLGVAIVGEMVGDTVGEKDVGKDVGEQVIPRLQQYLLHASETQH